MVRKSLARQTSQAENNPKSNRKESYARINPVASKEKECQRKYAEVKEFYEMENSKVAQKESPVQPFKIDVLWYHVRGTWKDSYNSEVSPIIFSFLSRVSIDDEISKYI